MKERKKKIGREGRRKEEEGWEEEEKRRDREKEEGNERRAWEGGNAKVRTCYTLNVKMETVYVKFYKITM